MEVTHFANPRLLWLLLLLLPMVAYYIYRTRQGDASIRISTVRPLEKVPKGYRFWLRHVPFLLRCGAVALLIVALARPQSSESGTNAVTEGIDIVLALDVSGSMLARDFRPDRITAARDVASKFIADRPNDRIGLVIFAGESLTQSPLTTDKATLLSLLGQVRSGMIEDGTAIGNGLATAVNRLRESDARSKVVILLTDGVNNSGQIAPLTASQIAASYGIRVYTVGVGTRGMAPYPMIDAWGNISYQPQPVEIDEDVLTQIARQTGGEYFRATDNQSLEKIYGQINQLEKSRIETNDFTRYHELYARFALWGLLLLLGEFVVRYLWLRRIP